MSWLISLFVVNTLLAALGTTLMFRASRQREALSHCNFELQKLESTDTLTGLPNRETLRALLVDALASKKDRPALLFVDLDGFKEVNDIFGHAVGDKLIQSVAERLGTLVKGPAILARMGGDEFAVLTTGAKASSHAVKLARGISDSLDKPFQLEGDSLQMKASIGIAPADESGMEAAEVLRRADVAMYCAKTDPDQVYRVYTPDMDETLRLRRSVSAELEAALDEGALRLVYQPLVCARTGKLVSAEALMRWPSKEGAAGSPGVFIPIAEETGLILQLGEWALNEALIQIKELGDIPIAVNVSPLQFRVKGFAESVETAIERHGVKPELLRIEITEGVLISHTEEAQETMQRLREMGVQVLLDDFGTGYSSLSYLQQFEFDGLKIDRAFIQQLESKKTGRQLLKSIIALGHSLNMKVIAEGVETNDQAAILQLLHCDFLQGYALGHPGEAATLTEMNKADAVPETGRRGEEWQRAVQR